MGILRRGGAALKLRKVIMQALIYLVLAAGLFVWMFPFFWILRTAFMTPLQIRAFPPVWVPSPFTLRNFTEGLMILPFGRFFVNTLFIVAVNLAGVLFTSTLAAYSFSRLRWPGRDMIFAILLTAMMLPGAVTLIPVFIAWSRLGLVNTYAPLTVPAWFGGGAFFIFLLRQFYLTIPREFDEAAIVDGAGYFRIYTSIMIPLIRPAFIAVTMFVFVNNWNDFMTPLIYLSDERLFTVSLGLRIFQGMFFTEYGFLMAAAAVSTAPVVIMFLIGQRYIVEGVVMSGIKG